MKKFFTLLCTGALAFSALAAKPLTKEELASMKFYMPEISQTKIKEMKEASHVARLTNDPNVITRSSMIDGVEWNVSIMNIGDFTQFGIYAEKDANGNPILWTFEQMPVYVAQMEIWNRLPQANNQTTTSLIYILCWPSEYLWTQIWDPNFNPDIDEINTAPVAPSVLMNETEREGLNTFAFSSFLTGDGTNDVGNFPCNWIVENNEVVGIESWAMIGVDALYSNRNTVNNATCIVTRTKNPNEKRTSIDFESYVPGDKMLSFFLRSFNTGITQTGQQDVPTGREYDITLNFSGTAYQVKGFEHVDYNFTPYEMHIFNDGVKNHDALFELGYQMEEMPDIQRYYFWISGNEYITCGFDAPEGNVKFNSSLLVPMWQPETPESAQLQSNMSWMYGALYAPANVSEFPKSATWKMKEIESEFDGYFWVIQTYPTGYDIFPSAYSYDLSENDGVNAVNGGLSVFVDCPSSLQVGSTDGLVAYISDITGDSYIVKSGNKKIYYHPNPQNVEEVVEIDPVGTDSPIENPLFAGLQNIFVDYPALDVRVNGRNIEAPEGSLIYDLNGRSVSGRSVSAGIYIVRNGRQTAKVLVK